MREKKSTLKAMLVGLLLAQLLSTLQVYLSNQRLYRALEAFESAGYVTVPNAIVAPSLKSLAVAFKGGLFFTLTTGMCLVFLSIAAAWIWVVLCHKRKAFLIPIGVVWAGLLAASNSKGFCSEAFAQFLLIPSVVFLAGLRWIPETGSFRIGMRHAAALAPLGVIILSAFFFTDTGIFINIRDKLLFSNPLGQRINAFYYRYTLYPAELFKAPAQKLLKTCRILIPDNPALARRVRGALARYDYLKVDREIPVDLTLKESGDQLVLSSAGKILILTDSRKMLSGTGKLLREFSKKADRYAFLRHFTLVSIFLVLPLVFIVILYAPVRLLTGLFVHSGVSMALSYLLCTVFLLAAMFFLVPGQEKLADSAELFAALDSDDLGHRISGLKHAHENRIDIADFPAYRKMAASTNPAERYWLAKALGSSRNPETLDDLFLLLEDRQPNVVCMALYSIGLRKNRSALNSIMEKLKTSNHWYVQWYAYRALKELGWSQTIK